MMNDDAIPCPVDCSTLFDGAPAECAGACWYQSTTTATSHGSFADLMQNVRAYCESPSLAQDVCSPHGVEGASFTWNPHLTSKLLRRCSSTTNGGSSSRRRFGWPNSLDPSFLHHHEHNERNLSSPSIASCPRQLCEHFWSALQAVADPNQFLTLGFHGTADEYIPHILKHGLDPKYRRTQAFGKGEYFSKEPGLAATYRKDSSSPSPDSQSPARQLLVFLLLIPPDHETTYHQKDRDIMVVDNPHHQIPVGILRFTGLDDHQVQHSQAMRLAQRHLKTEALQADWNVTEAKLVRRLKTLWRTGQLEQANREWQMATKYHKFSPEVIQRLAALIRPYVSTVKFDVKHETATQPRTSCSTLPSRLVEEQAHIPVVASPTLPYSASVPTNKTIIRLEEQAQQAWIDYWTMKLDPQRNLLPSNKKMMKLMPSSKTTSQTTEAPNMSDSTKGYFVDVQAGAAVIRESLENKEEEKAMRSVNNDPPVVKGLSTLKTGNAFNEEGLCYGRAANWTTNLTAMVLLGQC